MNEVNLFLAKDGNWVTNKTMIDSLISIEADKCDILFIHTIIGRFQQLMIVRVLWAKHYFYHQK